jgi:hypothetical protein
VRGRCNEFVPAGRKETHCPTANTNRREESHQKTRQQRSANKKSIHSLANAAPAGVHRLFISFSSQCNAHRSQLSRGEVIAVIASLN